MGSAPSSKVGDPREPGRSLTSECPRFRGGLRRPPAPPTRRVCSDSPFRQPPTGMAVRRAPLLANSDRTILPPPPRIDPRQKWSIHGGQGEGHMTVTPVARPDGRPRCYGHDRGVPIRGIRGLGQRGERRPGIDPGLRSPAALGKGAHRRPCRVPFGVPFPRIFPAVLGVYRC